MNSSANSVVHLILVLREVSARPYLDDWRPRAPPSLWRAERQTDWTSWLSNLEPQSGSWTLVIQPA